MTSSRRLAKLLAVGLIVLSIGVLWRWTFRSALSIKVMDNSICTLYAESFAGTLGIVIYSSEERQPRAIFVDYCERTNYCELEYAIKAHIHEIRQGLSSKDLNRFSIKRLLIEQFGMVKRPDPHLQTSVWFFPHWAMASLLVAIPFACIACRRMRNRYRKRNLMCMQCGYSLVGNESSKCPECGTPTEPEA